MDGILPLWKPKGMTSHDCVIKVRKLFHSKKVGHTGTLDPEVEGVLPICIGQATKIVPFLTDTTKTYIAEVTLGKATDTEDAHGIIIEEKNVKTPLSKQNIENVLQLFRGEINQIPPMYSAVKVNGRKLYEYARANESVERPERTVTIHELEMLEMNDTIFTFKAVCSKGTYIRTLCVDIGKSLGYPAYMSDLIRISTGSIMDKDTVTFTTIENTPERGNLLLPISRGVDHLDVLEVDEQTKMKVKNGQKLGIPERVLQTEPFSVMYKNELLAIYRIHPEKKDCIKPVRVFN
ncbi:tRNA pseudouridine(55) synthase TruB [Virgibacillus siamensis]|uniref:tRNA pseudouridine(55) synthase TruB n=1 Tax=Virgibacillus siamensis TaxID=480071 RepID=UPI000985BF60|nr:tRNA pseudouridine(55) synthase TruB [Virgibacillus siamensis]